MSYKNISGKQDGIGFQTSVKINRARRVNSDQSPEEDLPIEDVAPDRDARTHITVCDSKGADSSWVEISAGETLLRRWIGTGALIETIILRVLVALGVIAVIVSFMMLDELNCLRK